MVDKIRIAFVDDEPHILAGLRRVMRTNEDDWEMAFCPSGAELLDLMRSKPFDVVVSDMRMPDMDGAQLLEAVRKLQPATIRVILSGYADTKAVLRTVNPAHIYLAKPCTADDLGAALSRPLALRRLLASPDLQAALAGLTNLPSLDHLYLELEQELRSQTSSAKSVAAIIERDIAMTAELLKLTNSSYFSVGTRISTPIQAVRTLGFETIQSLVLQIGIFRRFQGSHAVAPMLTALTHHSLAVARLAEAAARIASTDPAIAQAARCAAMLSLIGCVILLDAHPDEYHQILAAVSPELPLHVIERQRLGASHAVIGAYLLALWGFSDPVLESVAYACDPMACPGRDNMVLTAVHVARALGPPMPILPCGGRDVPVLAMDYLIDARQDRYVRRWTALVKDNEGA